MYHRLDQWLRHRLWVFTIQHSCHNLKCQYHDCWLHLQFSGGCVFFTSRWSSSKCLSGGNTSDIWVRASFDHFVFHQVQSCFDPSSVWKYISRFSCQCFVDCVGRVGTVDSPGIESTYTYLRSIHCRRSSIADYFSSEYSGRNFHPRTFLHVYIASKSSGGTGSKVSYVCTDRIHRQSTTHKVFLSYMVSLHQALS